jgi:hypothetical protein
VKVAGRINTVERITTLTSSRLYCLVSGNNIYTVGKMMTMFMAAKKAYVPQPWQLVMDGKTGIRWKWHISVYPQVR